MRAVYETINYYITREMVGEFYSRFYVEEGALSHSMDVINKMILIRYNLLWLYLYTATRYRVNPTLTRIEVIHYSSVRNSFSRRCNTLHCRNSRDNQDRFGASKIEQCLRILRRRGDRGNFLIFREHFWRMEIIAISYR